jgi:hypothetical protein
MKLFIGHAHSSICSSSTKGNRLNTFNLSYKGSIVKRNYYNFTNAEYPDQRIPVGYWNDLQNQRNFFENMMQTLQLTHDELWNLKCISIINTKSCLRSLDNDLVKYKASSLIIHKYNGSVKKGQSSLHYILYKMHWRFYKFCKRFCRNIVVAYTTTTTILRQNLLQN